VRSDRGSTGGVAGDAGRSVQDGAAPVKPGDLLNWFGTVLDGLELASASICGHSYGAWLALSYALQAPARVDKLALIDPTAVLQVSAPAT
jgi:pimeloyl-ACP methyl ester carboxylesterase